MKNVARLALVKPEMELITKRWKALGGYSAPPQASTKYQEDLKQLFAKHDCSPGRSMIGVVVQVRRAFQDSTAQTTWLSDANTFSQGTE